MTTMEIFKADGITTSSDLNEAYGLEKRDGHGEIKRFRDHGELAKIGEWDQSDFLILDVSLDSVEGAATVLAARHSSDFVIPLVFVEISECGGYFNDAHLAIHGETDCQSVEANKSLHPKDRFFEAIFGDDTYRYRPSAKEKAEDYAYEVLNRTDSVIVKGDGMVAFSDLSEKVKRTISADLVDQCVHGRTGNYEDLPLYVLRAMIFGILESPVKPE